MSDLRPDLWKAGEANEPAPMTSEDYLRWEECQDLPWEFDGVRPVAMNGGTWGHSLLGGNLMTALNAALAGSTCRAVGPTMRVATGSGRYRYPDVVVACSVPRITRNLTEPLVIIEILSPGTAVDDRTTKLSEYQSIASLRQYVMFEPDRAFATIVSREGSGWSLKLVPAGGVIDLASLAVGLAVDPLYEGVL